MMMPTCSNIRVVNCTMNGSQLLLLLLVLIILMISHGARKQPIRHAAALVLVLVSLSPMQMLHGMLKVQWGLPDPSTPEEPQLHQQLQSSSPLFPDSHGMIETTANSNHAQGYLTPCLPKTHLSLCRAFCLACACGAASMSCLPALLAAGCRLLSGPGLVRDLGP